MERNLGREGIDTTELEAIDPSWKFLQCTGGEPLSLKVNGKWKMFIHKLNCSNKARDLASQTWDEVAALSYSTLQTGAGQPSNCFSPKNFR